MDELIKTIEYLRIKLCISKRSLAIKADITEEYYWKIVTGKAPGCSYSIIQSLCDAVGLKLTYSIDIEVLNELEKIKTK